MKKQAGRTQEPVPTAGTAWADGTGQHTATRVAPLKAVHPEVTRAGLSPTLVLAIIDKEKNNLFVALKRYNGTREKHYSLKVDNLLKTRWYRQ